jgi:hypothetical protein
MPYPLGAAMNLRYYLHRSKRHRLREPYMARARNFICKFTGDPCEQCHCKRGILCVAEVNSRTYQPAPVRDDEISLEPLSTYLRRRAIVWLEQQGISNPGDDAISATIDRKFPGDAWRRSYEEERQFRKAAVQRDRLKHGAAKR